MALTAAQITELMNNNPQFRQLVQQYGQPVSVGSCDDPGAKPGDICMEGACVNGQMLVMFCDGTMNCTGNGTVAC
jgi:hypothetical protein